MRKVDGEEEGVVKDRPMQIVSVTTQTGSHFAEDVSLQALEAKTEPGRGGGEGGCTPYHAWPWGGRRRRRRLYRVASWVGFSTIKRRRLRCFCNAKVSTKHLKRPPTTIMPVAPTTSTAMRAKATKEQEQSNKPQHQHT